MTVNEFLKDTYKEEAESQMFVRPMVCCKDVYTVSIQASYGHYCRKNDISGEYEEVELGYPSDVDEEFIPYAEYPEDLTGTVYICVPVKIVDKILEKHGGIDHLSYENV